MHNDIQKWMGAYLMTFNWHALQSFALISEHGSLSAAARSAGISQSTMSRHLSALEQAANARLIERGSSGVTLTSAGLSMLEHVKRMSDAASQLSYVLGPRQNPISGTVRVTASEFVAAFVLPDLLTSLRIEHPEIDFELVASDSTDNLLRRDADIAVRMYRPTQLDLISRKVGEIKLAAFASKAYVERCGSPTQAKDFLAHDLIGYDRSPAIIEGFQKAGFKIDKSAFAFRCDSQFVCWQMVLAGYGIGFFPEIMGAQTPSIFKLADLGEIGVLPIWLTANSELRTSLKLRTVFDALASALNQTCSQNE